MLNSQQKQSLQWEKVNDLIPAVVQDAVSGRVLMLGYMDREALEVTEKTRRVTFFSRTKNRLWTKGETSGNYLDVVSISPDCDYDALLILANPQGATCHTGNESCFADAHSAFVFLAELEKVIASRKTAAPETSYTAKLFHSGTKRIAQKVGEEGVETALAATVNNRDELKNEAADLVYHLLVLLQDQELSLSDVLAVLKSRHTKP